MVAYKRGVGCYDEVNSFLSPYRDIRKISSYIPACRLVVGSKKGEGNLSLPTTSKINQKLNKVLKRSSSFKGLNRKRLPGWVGLNFDLLLFGNVPSDGVSHRARVNEGSGSGGIDLIIADNSPKIESTPKTADPLDWKNATKSVEFVRTLLKYELQYNKLPFEVSKIIEILKGFEDGKKKLSKCKRRLIKLPNCSKFGHLRLEWRKEDLSLVRNEDDINTKLVKKAKLKYHPHRCHSRICPICGYFDRREHYGELIDLLEKSIENLNVKLAFATFTFKGFLSPLTAVEYAFQIRSKVYDLSLSKKFIKDLHPLVLKEIYAYGRGIRKKSPGEWRKLLKLHIKYIREFILWFEPILERKLREQKKVRIKDIFNLILKFEVHKTEKGLWHPHFHTIIDRFIPKLVLNAFWKYVSKGRGEITDIRELKGKKAIQEINKYITKPVSKITDLPKGVKEGVITSNGAKLSYEEILLLEFSLYQRQTYAVWGEWEGIRKELNKERKEHLKEKEKRSFHLYKVFVRMGQSMFHIPKALRFAEKTKSLVEIGKGEIQLGEIFVRTSIGYRLDIDEYRNIVENTPYLRPEVKVYATADGDIELKPVLRDEDLEAFYIVLVKAIKDHKEFRKFFNLPGKVEINLSLYEDIEEIPQPLKEDMEINGFCFVFDI